jgi:hypothetical protein
VPTLKTVNAEVEIRWDVEADQIDPDRWAEAILRMSAGDKTENASGQPTRWGLWPVVIMAVLVAVVAVITWGWTALVSFSPLFIVIAGLVVLNRTSRSRLANRIRTTSSAREAFTFTADASGTRSTSKTGSDRFAWSRYQRVVLDDELVLLRHDNDAVRVLPLAGLSSNLSPDAVVTTIAGWMDAARAEA